MFIIIAETYQNYAESLIEKVDKQGRSQGWGGRRRRISKIFIKYKIRIRAAKGFCPAHGFLREVQFIRLLDNVPRRESKNYLKGLLSTPYSTKF